MRHIWLTRRAFTSRQKNRCFWRGSVSNLHANWSRWGTKCFGGSASADRATPWSSAISSWKVQARAAIRGLAVFERRTATEVTKTKNRESAKERKNENN